MRRPLSDRAVYLLVGVAFIVAVILLAVVLASPAEGHIGRPSIDSSRPVGVGVTVVGSSELAGPHASSFRDLIAVTPAEGDPAYYAERHAASWEYTHLLNVACSDGSCWPVLWDHGLIQGDPDACWFACGHALPWEVEWAFDVVLGAWGVPGAGTTEPDADTAAPRVPVDAVPALTDPVALIHRYFPPDQWAKAERVMWCESNGVPTAKNPRSSASGLFQFLRSTWGWVAPLIDAPPFDVARFDPEWNVRMAAKLWEVGGWGHWVCQ